MIATEEGLTKLTTVSSEQEAAIIVAALIDEGIDACYMGETTANFRVGVPGKVHVYVSEAELERARRLFEGHEAAAKSLSLEEDEAETGGGWMWKSLVLLVLFLLLLIGVGGSGR